MPLYLSKFSYTPETWARLIGNPGCYPTGAFGLIRPFVKAGILPADGDVVLEMAGLNEDQRRRVAAERRRSTNNAASRQLMGRLAALSNGDEPPAAAEVTGGDGDGLG